MRLRSMCRYVIATFSLVAVCVFLLIVGATLGRSNTFLNGEDLPTSTREPMPQPPEKPFAAYTLGYTNPLDAALQARLTALDARLRLQYGMMTNQTAVGL